METKEYIKSYIDEVRNACSNEEGNLLGLSMGEWLTYLSFLEIIYNQYSRNYRRYEDIREEESKIIKTRGSGSHKMSKREYELYEESRELIINLRLNIESFITFTAILLNKLTNFPYRYFKHGVLNGISTGSHHQFWKAVLKSKNFVNQVDEGLRSNIEWMQNNVIDFRDHLIMHTLKIEQLERQLIRGFSHHPEKGGLLITGMLYPENNQNTSYQSTGILEIKKKIEEFVPQVIGFYRSNISISILK